VCLDQPARSRLGDPDFNSLCTVPTPMGLPYRLSERGAAYLDVCAIPHHDAIFKILNPLFKPTLQRCEDCLYPLSILRTPSADVSRVGHCATLFVHPVTITHSVNVYLVFGPLSKFPLPESHCQLWFVFLVASTSLLMAALDFILMLRG